MTDVTRFVDQHLTAGPKLLPGDVPEEMIDASAEAIDDWQPWRAIPANVSANELDELESELGIRLPPPFREFLSYLHFLELYAPSIRFCEHPPSWLEAKLDQQDMDLFSEDGRSLVSAASLGLFVIGDDPNDGGPVCLDLRRPIADGDCPVVFVDHETGSRTELFPSTASMFASVLEPSPMV